VIIIKNLMNKQCFIIAEIGVNHNGSIKIAKKLIDAAKESFVDSVKFQIYNTEKLVKQNLKKEPYQIKNNDNENQFEMLKRLELNFKEFKELSEYSKRKNIIFLATPYDEESADFIEELNVPIFKIGSGEITHLHLIKHIAKKNKQIILSTGASTIPEIRDAIKTIEFMNNKNIILLHCTSNYPTKLKDVNLKAMITLKKFGYPVGFSDHTTSNEPSIAAVSLGACVIEKHFTLNRNMEGPDHNASIEPCDLKKFVQSIRNTELLLGSFEKKPTKSEKITIQLGRRSIISFKDIKKGEIFKKEHIAIKRPGTGISSKYLEDFINKKASRNIKKDTLLNWNDIKK